LPPNYNIFVRRTHSFQIIILTGNVSEQVAWLRVDTQTILTIGSQIITKNHRIAISNTEKKIWQLRIREVKESDKGYYMCQINTDPMKSQMGYLNVVGKQSFPFCVLKIKIVMYLSITGYSRRSIHES
jgi:Immunoglobulin I-set domain